MTTRERIQALYNDGHEAHVIAAIIGTNATDVATTLADASHTPENPSGGGGANFARVYQEGDWGFANGEVPLRILLGVENIEPEVTLTSLAVVGAGGVVTRSRIFMEMQETGPWASGIKAHVKKVGGGQSILVQGAVALSAGKWVSLSSDTAEVASSTGEDLTVKATSDPFEIVSAAGGEFIVETDFSFLED